MKIFPPIRILGALAAILFAATAGAALAQNPSGAGAGTQAALEPPASAAANPAEKAAAEVGHAPQKPALTDLSWLVGRWQGAWGPRSAQQVWTAPKAGVMMGTFQLEENDKTLVLEVFAVVDSPDGIKIHLRHFTPSLVSWEKTAPTVLELSSVDSKSVVFENHVDGQPKRTTLTRVDPDTYTVRSEIIPEKGDPQVTEITYHRLKETPPAKSKH